MTESYSHNSQTSEAESIDNGLILNDKLLALELIQRILCYVDVKTLLNCQLVCKSWNDIIVDYVWRKKAELKIRCKIPIDTVLQTKDFYLLSLKNLFERNLMDNHSGEKRFEHWHVTQNHGNGWIIECPPVGAPLLPPAPEFGGKQHCFATSFGMCSKHYSIDLIEEGFSSNILDQLQPSIEISEWYCCRFDCPAVYEMRVILFNRSGEKLKDFSFDDTLRGERQNTWFNVKHEFKNYGKGLRKIQFIHSGRDRQFWAGHYGSKMAGAWITVKIPDVFKKLN